MTQIELTHLRKSFGKVEVIPDLTLTFPSREFSVIVGPSGCGKSTLLRLLAGLEEPNSGRILIGGIDVTNIPPSKRGIAMVFQSYALYPHMTVFGNMAFGLKLSKLGKTEISRKVHEAAEKLNLSALLARKPKELSGGQRQRVAIGRAIVRDPKIFLFDEPLSNLDAGLRHQMRAELLKLRDELRTTMVYVTHDQIEAMTLADQIILLNHGRVAQMGTPLDLYHHPKSAFVGGFLGTPAMNLLAAEFLGVDGENAQFHLQSEEMFVLPRAHVNGLTQGTKITLGIRPEHLQLVPPVAASLKGQVHWCESLGKETYLHVRLGKGDSPILVVRCDSPSPPARGSEIGLEPKPECCHFFEA